MYNGQQNKLLVSVNGEKEVCLMESVFWLIVFIVSLAAEIVTLGLVSIWFAVAALAAFILAVFGVNLWIQIVVFFIVSILLLLSLRPFAAHFINKDKIRTNVEAAAGKTVRITETVDNMQGVGHAMLDGMEWMARSADEDVLEKDTLAIVVRVEGVKLIVKAAQEN